MEQEKLHLDHREGFAFAGAIFMSNRATKLECLQRKLFGLPQSKAKFLKQVKAGMILFLFEHEERKLYGVFEATSDGALNIIPDAFRSTGHSFPAQICCKRILMCRPLCEDEFRSAIQENYYSPNKFHFGLSYDQVKNLIHLFYLKKINLNQHQKPMLPNKIIERLENSAAEKVRLTEVGSDVKCEYSREGKQEARRKYTLPQSSLDLPMHYTATDTGRGSNQVNLRALVPPPSYSQHLYSEPVDSSCGSLFIPDDRATFRHFSPGNQRTTTEEIKFNKPSPRELDRYATKFDSVEAPYSTGRHRYSSPDAAACVLSRDDMIPRQIKFQEPRVFESLRVVNDDHHQTVVLQHTSVYGAQPDQLFEFPDYIPLPEDLQQDFVEENQNSGGGNLEYVSSAAFRSCIPSTCKEISKAFYTDDDDELNSYGRLVSDDYPAVSRASVFSRLSRDQNVPKRKTPEPPTSSPLDQLLNKLGSRRERRSTMETSKQSGKWGSGDQYDRTVSTGLVDQSSGRNEVSEKESFERPFYNFRRRNMSQKFEVLDDLNTCSKRRRLLRPSLSGEQQNAKDKSQTKEETEVKNENENKANCLKSEPEGESVSSFVCLEAEAKVPTRVISEHETESMAPGFQTRQKSEKKGESVSSFICTKTEVKTPTQAVLEHETESKVPGFQTRQKCKMEGESVSSFICTETEVETPTRAISKHETESKVPGFQTRQKSKMDSKSVEAKCATFVLESEDYIPLG